MNKEFCDILKLSESMQSLSVFGLLSYFYLPSFNGFLAPFQKLRMKVFRKRKTFQFVRNHLEVQVIRGFLFNISKKSSLAINYLIIFNAESQCATVRKIEGTSNWAELLQSMNCLFPYLL